MSDREEPPGAPQPPAAPPAAPPPVPPVPPVPSGWSTEQPPAWGAPSGSPYAPDTPPAPPSHAYPGWGGQPQPAWTGHPAWNYGPPPAPKPGVVPLRPLGIGELLDGAITSMRTHPRVMLGLSAVVAIVSSLLQFLLTWWALSDLAGEVSELDDPDASVGDVFNAMSGTFAATGVSAVVTVLAQIVLTGLLTVVVSRLVLGEKVTAGEAWARLRPHIWRLLGVSILAFLIVFGVFVGAILLGVFAIIAAGGVVGGLVLALGIIGGGALAVYLYVALALAGPALVLERIGVIASLRRSRRLVTGSWWRVFGILLLATIIAFVLSGIIAIPFQVIGTIVGGGFEDVDAPFSMGALVITSIGSVIATTITLPFAAAISVLLYIDQRMRREGLDLELARAAGIPGNQQAVDPRTAPAGPADPPLPPQTW